MAIADNQVVHVQCTQVSHVLILLIVHRPKTSNKEYSIACLRKVSSVDSNQQVDCQEWKDYSQHRQFEPRGRTLAVMDD